MIQARLLADRRACMTNCRWIKVKDHFILPCAYQSWMGSLISVSDDFSKSQCNLENMTRDLEDIETEKKVKREANRFSKESLHRLGIQVCGPLYCPNKSCRAEVGLFDLSKSLVFTDPFTGQNSYLSFHGLYSHAISPNDRDL